MWESPSARERILACLDRGETSNIEISGSSSYGKLLRVRLYFAPLHDKDGTVHGCMIMCEDVASQRDLEEQLAQSQKLEALGRLAGGVAHDFNNILSAIIGYSEMILRNLSPDDPLREQMTVILESGERAANLTGQLLAFSRKQSFSPEVLNLNTLVGGLHKMLTRIISENVTTRFDEGEGLWNVMADVTHMEQIIVNLAVNARDAMPEGGVLTIGTGNVSCGESDCREEGTVPPGDYVVLTVADSGSGIAEEDVSRIFEPFFTTKEEGKGTGLGLSTVYGVVKQSGGHIFVRSRLGEGTTFRIYLPRTREEAKAIPDREEPLPRGDETILLVEDQLEVRKLALLVLSDLGYTVLEAGDGVEAIELYTKFHGRIHLLLSDVIMRNMGGRELAERIRKINGDIRVLFMTGYAEEMVTSRDSASGGSVLMKPISAPKLAAAVRKVLDVPGRRREEDQA
jgi:two-component system cell cycle sensor histidine kinase/response regulator CckA